MSLVPESRALVHETIPMQIACGTPSNEARNEVIHKLTALTDTIWSILLSLFHISRANNRADDLDLELGPMLFQKA